MITCTRILRRNPAGTYCSPAPPSLSLDEDSTLLLQIRYNINYQPLAPVVIPALARLIMSLTWHTAPNATMCCDFILMALVYQPYTSLGDQVIIMDSHLYASGESKI